MAKKKKGDSDVKPPRKSAPRKSAPRPRKSKPDLPVVTEPEAPVVTDPAAPVVEHQLSLPLAPVEPAPLPMPPVPEPPPVAPEPVPEPPPPAALEPPPVAPEPVPEPPPTAPEPPPASTPPWVRWLRHTAVALAIFTVTALAAVFLIDNWPVADEAPVPQQLTALRRAQLETWSWVDRDKNLVRMPISRAMQQVAEGKR